MINALDTQNAASGGDVADGEITYSQVNSISL